MLNFPYRRIVVIGSTGSGKTTVAEKLSIHLGIKHIEIDAIYWKPGWIPAPQAEVRRLIEVESDSPAWVSDGNYRFCRDILWERADAIVWLDYSLWITFWRLWHRTWKRWWTRELLWGTNYETLLNHFRFWSNDSLFNYLFKTYARRKSEYEQLIRERVYSRLQVFHFTQPKQTDSWLDSLFQG